MRLSCSSSFHFHCVDLALPFRGIPEPVRTLADQAVEQQTPIVVTGPESLLGNGNHAIRHFENRSNLYVGSMFQRSLFLLEAASASNVPRLIITIANTGNYR